MENIALFCDIELLVRLRNVSSKARKIVESTVRDKKVIVPFFNGTKGKVLNSKIWFKGGASIDGNKIEPSVANYFVRDMEDLAEIPGGKVFCSLDLEARIKGRIDFERVDKMKIDSGNWERYLKCNFKKVDSLSITNLESEQIKQVLDKIEEITEIIFTKCLLNSSISGFTAEKVVLKKCEIQDKLEIKGVKTLEAVSCSNIQNLTSRSTISLYLEGITNDLQDWFASFIKLKEFSVTDDEFNTELSAFSPNLMHLRIFESLTPDLTGLERFKCLRTLSLEEVNSPVSNKSLKSLETQGIEQNCLNLEIRLKKVTINSENADFFNKNPSLIANLSSVSVSSSDFNLDNLPFGLIKASLTEFNHSSSYLIRSNSQYRQIYWLSPYKLLHSKQRMRSLDSSQI